MQMRSLTFMLVICALVTAMISPACQFMSGQAAGVSMIEICSALGDQVRLVAVQNDGGASTQDKTGAAQPDCGFCFAQGHIKPAFIQALTVPLLTGGEYILASAGTIAPQRTLGRLYQSRAPPIVLA